MPTRFIFTLQLAPSSMYPDSWLHSRYLCYLWGCRPWGWVPQVWALAACGSAPPSPLAAGFLPGGTFGLVRGVLVAGLQVDRPVGVLPPWGVLQLQKHLVRLITKAHYLANTAPLFSQLKVLDIFSTNSFSVPTFMHSYHHNLLPSSFHDLFLSTNQVHQHETRLPSQYRPRFCRTNIKQFSMLY